MFLVINMNKHTLNFFFFVAIALPNIALANNENDIKALQSNSLQKNEINPLSEVKISFDKKVNFKNQPIELNSTENVTSQLSNPRADKTFILNKGEFVQILGSDKINKLFNGSIIIKFNAVPNFSDYAISKEIEFISDLSNIKRGIFKINNLYDLQMKIDEIKLDENVLEIELDLIDPRLKSE